MTEPNQKAEPEGLVLRGKPRRVTRFRRPVVIGAVATVTVMVCGAAWLALRAPSLKVKVSGDELYNTDSKPAADRLAGLPASYDKVKIPKLGPPLPGDLGLPIVSREKQLGVNPVSGSFGESDAEHAEHLRQAQLAQQAREAKVMFQVSGAGRVESVLSAQQSHSPSQATYSLTNPVLPDDQNQQQHKLDFARWQDDGGIYNTHALQTPVSPYELLAGTIIPASLITGLNSDLPGPVIAQVTQDLFDSVSGRVLLVPQGTRLIGKYDSVVAFGQSRALVVWQRIVMPNGTSVEIDNMPATDTEGYAGLEDEVDYHTWRLIKGVTLSTMLGIGTQLSVNNSNNDLLTALRQSTQDSVNQAGQQITQRNLNIQPTITVRPGWPLQVIVSKDIVLRPYQS
jgi:type IV secretion system protein VirB10